MMDFAFKTRNCVSKSHKIEEFCIEITQKRGSLYSKRWVLQATFARHLKEEVCIQNDEPCIENDEFCCKNDGFCIRLATHAVS